MPEPIEPPLPTAPISAGSAGATPAVQGTSFWSSPVIPTLGSAPGVVGNSGSGPGVVGKSNSGDAIAGTTSSLENADVSAINTGGGYGVWAKATGTQAGSGGVAGYFEYRW
jgi:hypothetical protein